MRPRQSYHICTEVLKAGRMADKGAHGPWARPLPALAIHQNKGPTHLCRTLFYVALAQAPQPDGSGHAVSGLDAATPHQTQPAQTRQQQQRRCRQRNRIYFGQGVVRGNKRPDKS